MTLSELIAWGRRKDPRAPLILPLGLIGLAMAAALVVIGG